MTRRRGALRPRILSSCGKEMSLSEIDATSVDAERSSIRNLPSKHPSGAMGIGASHDRNSPLVCL